MKTSNFLVSLITAAIMAMLSMPALAELDISLASADAFSSASGNVVWVAGGAAASSQAVAVDGGFASIASSEGIAAYSAAGHGEAGGVAAVDTGAIAEATPWSASSIAGSSEQSEAFAFDGGATAVTAGQSSSLSIGPNSIAEAGAQELSVSVDTGFFANAAEHGSTLAGTSVQ